MENEFDIPTEQPLIQQKSSFKLWKNAKSNWQYEIKIYGDNIKEIQDNTKLMEKWSEENYGAKDAAN